MKIETALNLVGQAVASYKGTFDDHKKLQEAMETLRKSVTKPEKVEKPKKAEKEQK